MSRVIYFSLVCWIGFSLQACQTLESKQEEPTNNNYVYLRTSELISLQKRLALLTDDYLKKQEEKKVVRNRRELGTLADEVSRDQVKQRKEVERELVKRFLAGDQEAHFKGIEIDLNNQ